LVRKRLPVDWRPSPETWARAAECGFPDARLEIVLADHVRFCQRGSTPWFEKTAEEWDDLFVERCRKIASRRKDLPDERLSKPTGRVSSHALAARLIAAAENAFRGAGDAAPATG
jgi:hypothetical protein